MADGLLKLIGGKGKPLPHPGQVDGPFQQAITQYPAMRGLGLQLKTSPNKSGNMLEYWPAGETGDTSYPRPNSLNINAPGIEIFSDKTRPIDVLGDVVSHGLVNTDPKIKQYYDKFKNSLTIDQDKNLFEQYKYATLPVEQGGEGEKRPFMEWRTTSGLPAYFRGYAFQQWPDAKSYYTPEQISMFDEMMGYLSSPKKGLLSMGNK